MQTTMTSLNVKSISKLTVKLLREELANRNLETTGLKPELVERLTKDVVSKEEAKPQTTDESANTASTSVADAQEAPKMEDVAAAPPKADDATTATTEPSNFGQAASVAAADSVQEEKKEDTKVDEPVNPAPITTLSGVPIETTDYSQTSEPVVPPEELPSGVEEPVAQQKSDPDNMQPLPQEALKPDDVLPPPKSLDGVDETAKLSKVIRMREPAATQVSAELEESNKRKAEDMQNGTAEGSSEAAEKKLKLDEPPIVNSL